MHQSKSCFRVAYNNILTITHECALNNPFDLFGFKRFDTSRRKKDNLIITDIKIDIPWDMSMFTKQVSTDVQRRVLLLHDLSTVSRRLYEIEVNIRSRTKATKIDAKKFSLILSEKISIVIVGLVLVKHIYFPHEEEFHFDGLIKTCIDLFETRKDIKALFTLFDLLCQCHHQKVVKEDKDASGLLDDLLNDPKGNWTNFEQLCSNKYHPEHYRDNTLQYFEKKYGERDEQTSTLFVKDEKMLKESETFHWMKLLVARMKYGPDYNATRIDCNGCIKRALLFLHGTTNKKLREKEKKRHERLLRSSSSSYFNPSVEEVEKNRAEVTKGSASKVQMLEVVASGLTTIVHQNITINKISIHSNPAIVTPAQNTTKGTSTIENDASESRDDVNSALEFILMDVFFMEKEIMKKKLDINENDDDYLDIDKKFQHFQEDELSPEVVKNRVEIGIALLSSWELGDEWTKDDFERLLEWFVFEDDASRHCVKHCFHRKVEKDKAKKIFIMKFRMKIKRTMSVQSTFQKQVKSLARNLEKFAEKWNGEDTSVRAIRSNFDKEQLDNILEGVEEGSNIVKFIMAEFESYDASSFAKVSLYNKIVQTFPMLHKSKDRWMKLKIYLHWTIRHRETECKSQLPERQDELKYIHDIDFNFIHYHLEHSVYRESYLPRRKVLFGFGIHQAENLLKNCINRHDIEAILNGPIMCEETASFHAVDLWKKIDKFGIPEEKSLMILNLLHWIAIKRSYIYGLKETEDDWSDLPTQKVEIPSTNAFEISSKEACKEYLDEKFSLHYLYQVSLLRRQNFDVDVAIFDSFNNEIFSKSGLDEFTQKNIAQNFRKRLDDDKTSETILFQVLCCWDSANYERMATIEFVLNWSADMYQQICTKYNHSVPLTPLKLLPIFDQETKTFTEVNKALCAGHKSCIEYRDTKEEKQSSCDETVLHYARVVFYTLLRNSKEGSSIFQTMSELLPGESFRAILVWKQVSQNHQDMQHHLRIDLLVILVFLQKMLNQTTSVDLHWTNIFDDEFLEFQARKSYEGKVLLSRAELLSDYIIHVLYPLLPIQEKVLEEVNVPGFNEYNLWRSLQQEQISREAFRRLSGFICWIGMKKKVLSEIADEEDPWLDIPTEDPVNLGELLFSKESTDELKAYLDYEFLLFHLNMKYDKLLSTKFLPPDINDVMAFKNEIISKCFRDHPISKKYSEKLDDALRNELSVQNIGSDIFDGCFYLDNDSRRVFRDVMEWIVCVCKSLPSVGLKPQGCDPDTPSDLNDEDEEQSYPKRNLERDEFATIESLIIKLPTTEDDASSSDVISDVTTPVQKDTQDTGTQVSPCDKPQEQVDSSGRNENVSSTVDNLYADDEKEEKLGNILQLKSNDKTFFSEIEMGGYVQVLDEHKSIEPPTNQIAGLNTLRFVASIALSEILPSVSSKQKETLLDIIVPSNGFLSFNVDGLTEIYVKKSEAIKIATLRYFINAQIMEWVSKLPDTSVLPDNWEDVTICCSIVEDDNDSISYAEFENLESFLESAVLKNISLDNVHLKIRITENILENIYRLRAVYENVSVWLCSCEDPQYGHVSREKAARFYFHVLGYDYDKDFSEVEQKRYYIIDVDGDGNCWFYASKLAMLNAEGLKRREPSNDYFRFDVIQQRSSFRTAAEQMNMYSFLELSQNLSEEDSVNRAIDEILQGIYVKKLPNGVPNFTTFYKDIRDKPEYHVDAIHTPHLFAKWKQLRVVVVYRVEWTNSFSYSTKIYDFRNGNHKIEDHNSVFRVPDEDFDHKTIELMHTSKNMEDGHFMWLKRSGPMVETNEMQQQGGDQIHEIEQQQVGGLEGQNGVIQNEKHHEEEQEGEVELDDDATAAMDDEAEPKDHEQQETTKLLKHNPKQQSEARHIVVVRQGDTTHNDKHDKEQERDTQSDQDDDETRDSETREETEHSLSSGEGVGIDNQAIENNAVDDDATSAESHKELQMAKGQQNKAQPTQNNKQHDGEQEREVQSEQDDDKTNDSESSEESEDQLISCERAGINNTATKNNAVDDDATSAEDHNEQEMAKEQQNKAQPKQNDKQHDEHQEWHAQSDQDDNETHDSERGEKTEDTPIFGEQVGINNQATKNNAYDDDVVCAENHEEQERAKVLKDEVVASFSALMNSAHKNTVDEVAVTQKESKMEHKDIRNVENKVPEINFLKIATQEDTKDRIGYSQVYDVDKSFKYVFTASNAYINFAPNVHFHNLTTIPTKMLVDLLPDIVVKEARSLVWIQPSESYANNSFGVVRDRHVSFASSFDELKKKVDFCTIISHVWKNGCSQNKRDTSIRLDIDLKDSNEQHNNIQFHENINFISQMVLNVIHQQYPNSKFQDIYDPTNSEENFPCAISIEIVEAKVLENEQNLYEIHQPNWNNIRKNLSASFNIYFFGNKVDPIEVCPDTKLYHLRVYFYNLYSGEA